MEMIKKVVIKDDLKAMRESFMAELAASTKVTVSEAVDPLKNEIADVKANTASMSKKV